MSHESTARDIRIFLEAALMKDRRFQHSRWTPELKALIVGHIPTKAKGMYVKGNFVMVRK
jgi:hypothetical protein